MKQEDKELLLKDLNARLSYGVKVRIEGNYFYGESEPYDTILKSEVLGHLIADAYSIKPYLRPMSSMTKEERKELNNQGYTKIAGELYHYCALSSDNAFYNPERHSYVRLEYVIKLIDWLNSHHFDYRGLIEKGLALEAPKGYI